MCTITTVINDKERVTGYKYALKKKSNGKYYSPAIGCEYKVGRVPRCRKQKALDDGFISIILRRDGPIFNKLFYGKTSVFISYCDAYNFIWNHRRVILSGYIFVILKMTLSKNLFNGFYDYKRLYIGEYIESIEEVAEYKRGL
jgi:hypothetical protein